MSYPNYATGYAGSLMPVGGELVEVARVSRSDFAHRHIAVAAAFSIPDAIAMDAILAADEMGHDTGRPRDKKRRK